MAEEHTVDAAEALHIIDWLAEGLVVISPDGRIIFANRAAYRILCRNEERLLGERYVDIPWRAQDVGGRPYLAEKLPFAEALETGKPISDISLVAQRPDGPHRLLANAVPLYEKNELEAVAVSFLDVTGLLDRAESGKGTEAAVSASSHLLSTLPAPIAYIDSSGIITSANPAAAAALDREPGELVGQPIRAAVGENPVLAEAVESVLETGQSYERSLEIRRRDGRIQHFLVRAAPDREDGRVAGVVLEGSDITQFVVSAARAERRFRAVFDAAGAGIVLGDVHGIIVETNAAFDRMLGYERGATRGMPLTDFTFIEDAVLDTSLLEEMLAGKRDSYEIEKRYIRKDKSVIWGHLVASAVRDEHDRTSYTVGVLEDISERKKAEDYLREKDQGIRQAYTDVIAAVTGGKLVLMTVDELGEQLGEVALPPRPLRNAEELADARHELKLTLEKLRPLKVDIPAVILGASEALTNALKHGRAGQYALRYTDSYAQVVITDFGPGIDFRTLPKATLVPGFSTEQSLGMGFTIMLQVCDRLLLATQPHLTSVVLEMAFSGPAAHGDAS